MKTHPACTLQRQLSVPVPPRKTAASRHPFWLLVLMVSLSGPGLCAAAETEWRGSSEIKFSGTSTLHAWSGTVPVEPFVARVSTNAKGRPTALKARVGVEVRKMDTKESDRDKNLRSSMKAESFPIITGIMEVAFDKVMLPGEKAPSHLPFKLLLLGKEHAVDSTISNWSLTGNTATFDLDFSLSLRQCGISVPSFLLVVRVGDVVKLHATVKLVRA